MKYETAIFDLDGTLLDTLEDLKNACNHSLRTIGFPERSLDEIRRFVGNGILTTIRRAVPPGTDEESVQHAYRLFIPWYKEHCMDNTKPYEGIAEAISTLRSSGIRTAVVSNKADPAVQELCEHFFAGLFDAAAGEKPGVRKKPAPDTVLSVMDILGCDPAKTVYIGDSEVDIQTAANAGIPCISVTWGFRDRKSLSAHGGSDFADSPDDLLPLIL